MWLNDKHGTNLIKNKETVMAKKNVAKRPGSVGDSLRDLKLPVPKPVKSGGDTGADADRPALMDKTAKKAVKDARKKRIANAEQLAIEAKKFAKQMKESALEFAELYLDEAMAEPEDGEALTDEEEQAAANCRQHRRWIRNKIRHPKPVIAKACQVALFQGLCAVELRSHKELGDLCSFLAEEGQLKALPKRTRGDVKQYGVSYDFVTKGLTVAQSSQQKSALMGAQKRVWGVVRPAWKKLAEEMPGMATINHTQLMDRTPGDVLLIVPSKKEVWYGVEKYVEGGSFILRSDGNRVCFVEVANELKRADGKPAWGNFAQYVQEFMDYGEAAVIPLGCILDSRNPNFPLTTLGKKKYMLWRRIREAIYNMRVLAGEVEPEPARPASKPRAEKKPRVKKTVKK